MMRPRLFPPPTIRGNSIQTDLGAVESVPLAYVKTSGTPPKPRPLEAGSEEQNKPHPDLPLREAVPPKETCAPSPSVGRLLETPRLALWLNLTGWPGGLRAIRSSLAGFRKKNA